MLSIAHLPTALWEKLPPHLRDNVAKWWNARLPREQTVLIVGAASLLITALFLVGDWAWRLDNTLNKQLPKLRAQVAESAFYAASIEMGRQKPAKNPPQAVLRAKFALGSSGHFVGDAVPTSADKNPSDETTLYRIPINSGEGIAVFRFLYILEDTAGLMIHEVSLSPDASHRWSGSIVVGK